MLGVSSSPPIPMLFGANKRRHYEDLGVSKTERLGFGRESGARLPDV